LLFEGITNRSADWGRPILSIACSADVGIIQKESSLSAKFAALAGPFIFAAVAKSHAV